MINKLTAKSTERAELHIVIGVEGIEKNSKATSKFPTVRVVKEKSKKPEPRLFIPGGLTKIEMSSTSHQKNVIPEKRRVKCRSARTLHRLYGDT
jgi:hypothetical protein